MTAPVLAALNFNRRDRQKQTKPSNGADGGGAERAERLGARLPELKDTWAAEGQHRTRGSSPRPPYAEPGLSLPCGPGRAIERKAARASQLDLGGREEVCLEQGCWEGGAAASGEARRGRRPVATG